MIRTNATAPRDRTGRVPRRKPPDLPGPVPGRVILAATAVFLLLVLPFLLTP